MHRTLSAEHEHLRDVVARFVRDELDPHAAEWEAAGTAPLHEIFGKAGRLGLLGVDKPEAYGGAGLDFSYVAVVAEALGHSVAAGIPFAMGAHTSAMPALANYGSDALRSEFLAPAIAGDMVACIGVSEPAAGSDVSAIRTTARRDGGDWVIRGDKMWTSNSTQGDWIAVLANTSDENGPHRNKSLILVPIDTPGVSVGKKLHKLGMQSSDTAPVFFDDVRVPAAHLIGEEGMGFLYQMQQFQHERLWVSLRTLAALEDAVTLTAEYAADRKLFGKPLIQNQVIYHRLADYRSQLEALRALAYASVDAKARGEDVTMSASMVKYLAGKLALEIPNHCAQIFGGQGFMWESRITQILRDIRIAAVGGGANEVMLEVIAKQAGYVGRRAARA